MDQFLWYIYVIPIMIISATVHEFAHAWTAYKLGDDTARDEGRMTLNPIAHIDPVGFLFMIFARIGWAKPVPVNTYNLKNPMQGQLLVAIAGPISNILLVFVAATLLKIFTLLPISNQVIQDFSVQFFIAFIVVNFSLAFFNMIPIPPLDGGNIVEALLPKQFRNTWQDIAKYSPFALLLLFLPISPFFAIFSNFWYNFIANAVSTVLTLFGIV